MASDHVTIGYLPWHDGLWVHAYLRANSPLDSSDTVRVFSHSGRPAQARPSLTGACNRPCPTEHGATQLGGPAVHARRKVRRAWINSGYFDDIERSTQLTDNVLKIWIVRNFTEIRTARLI